MKYALLALILCAYSAPGFAQAVFNTVKTTNARSAKDYERAMTMIELGQLEEANNLLSRAIKVDSLFIDAIIQLAGVRHDQGQLADAEQQFEKVLQIAPGYRKTVWLQLGLTEWRLDKFDEAEDHFKGFLALDPSNEQDIALAKGYLAKCAFSASAMRNPVPFQPRKLGPEVNTDNDEYLPSLTADAKTLIFTRVIGNDENFYLSQQTPEGNWTSASPIDRVNTPENEGAQTVSPDGRRLIFTACNRPGGVGKCDLYVTEYQNGQWTPVRNMGEPVNSGAWESQPSLSGDGNALFFAANRSGGKGGKDLWVSNRLADGTWAVPQNLGDSLNTGRDEQGPFIHPDGQTLYFMSDGHPGMGGADIFFSRKGVDGAWGKPVNMGYPINSKSDEGLLVVSLDGKTAYFASNRSDLNPTLAYGKPTYDIFAFDLHEAARPLPVTYVKAIVRDARTKAPLQATAEIIDLGSGLSTFSATTGKDGEFLVVLPAGKNYSLNVSRPKYLFYSDHFELHEPSSADKPYLLEIELFPVPENGAPATENAIVLKNVFFEFGSAALLPASLSELEKLRKLLLDNPGLRIQINGHTDNVGADAANQLLSEQRAKAVYTWLLDKGIEKARLRFKGFGETRPVDTNDSDPGRQKNRRTEFETF